MTPARQNTTKAFLVGPILDADGVLVTNAIVANLKLSKSGDVPAALNASSTLSAHQGGGFYIYTGDDSDVDTVGEVVVIVDSGQITMPPLRLFVIAQPVFDVLFASASVGPLPADMIDDIAAEVETAFLNENDLRPFLQQMADKIAADWVAGDASPLAIIAALKADAQWTNLATLATNLALVPKSNGAVSFNGTALAAIQSGLATLVNQTTIINGLGVLTSGERDTLAALVNTVLTAAHGANSWQQGNTVIPPTKELIAEEVDSVLTANHPGDWAAIGGSSGGAGAFAINLTIKDDDSVIITDCDVILTTSDAEPSIGVYASAVSNGSGIATFMVDAGTYYVWRQKGGINFSDNPITIIVDADGDVVLG